MTLGPHGLMEVLTTVQNIIDMVLMTPCWDCAFCENEGQSSFAYHFSWRLQQPLAPSKCSIHECMKPFVEQLPSLLLVWLPWGAVSHSISHTDRTEIVRVSPAQTLRLQFPLAPQKTRKGFLVLLEGARSTQKPVFCELRHWKVLLLGRGRRGRERERD